MSNVFYLSPAKTYPEAVRAEGVWIWDGDGKRYMDGSGGACVVSIGHGVAEIRAAALAQMDAISFAHRSQFTTAACEELSRRVTALSPDPELDRVHFVSGGSEAVESAVKLARQYWRTVDRPDRFKVISRWTAYHGNTAGALALSGHTGRRSPYQPLILHTPHVEPCYCYRCPYGRTPADCGLLCADALDRAICYEGPDSVAAFIAEPVVGATAGVLVPPDGYWQRIREICDRYQILLIADEVMTGAGRTGKPLALEHWGVHADLVVLAKGLSSGYAPLGAVLVRRALHDAIRDGSGAFTHGHTYGQHPVSAAVGAAVLRYLEEHALVARSARLGAHLLERLGELADHPLVGDVRGLGLFAGVELVADKASREPFEARHKVASKVAAAAFARGLITYPGDGGADGIRGDHLLLCPPFCVTEGEIEFLVQTLGEALDEGAAALARQR
ncbi:MAG TPA: aspartate aminotransferase family protein [Deferrisomatales bacterium]|nr:aspartate aminotransferase family protein [Deferrisomatales bacterium]